MIMMMMMMIIIIIIIIIIIFVIIINCYYYYYYDFPNNHGHIPCPLVFKQSLLDHQAFASILFTLHIPSSKIFQPPAVITIG